MANGAKCEVVDVKSVARIIRQFRLLESERKQDTKGVHRMLDATGDVLNLLKKVSKSRDESEMIRSVMFVSHIFIERTLNGSRILKPDIAGTLVGVFEKLSGVNPASKYRTKKK